MHSVAIAMTGGLLIFGVAEIAITIRRKAARIAQALRGEPEILECPGDWLA